MLSVAVGPSGGPPRAEANELVGRRHMERLFPAIEAVLDGAATTPAALSAILVGLGPGSFTGTRIGVAAARGLAQALEVPLWGAMSSTLMAREAVQAEPSAKLCAVILDAKRGELFLGRYDGRGRQLERPTVISPAALLDWDWEPGTIFCGDALLSYPELASELGSRAPDLILSAVRYPRAAQLLSLAPTELPSPRELHSVIPLYLRPSQAEERRDAGA